MFDLDQLKIEDDIQDGPIGGRIAYVSKDSLLSSVSEDLLAEGSHEYRHATNIGIEEELPGWFPRGKEGFRRP